MNNLVTAKWLHENLHDPNIVIFDASMRNPLPGQKNQAKRAYIPDARLFDFEQSICDQNASLSYMMPDAEQFQQQVRELGVNQASTIVVYDNMGIYSSPRAWWMFKSMGAKKVYVLDGGSPAWQALDLSLVDAPVRDVPHGDFVCKPSPGFFVDRDTILEATSQEQVCIIDARSPSRFTGEEKDPRPHVRAGHIASSLNLHYKLLTQDGLMKSESELQQLFQQRQLNQQTPCLFSCGSGITACILALAATQLGMTQLSVYDGSWSDWGADSSLPVELG